MSARTNRKILTAHAHEITDPDMWWSWWGGFLENYHPDSHFALRSVLDNNWAEIKWAACDLGVIPKDWREAPRHPEILKTHDGMPFVEPTLVGFRATFVMLDGQTPDDFVKHAGQMKHAFMVPKIHVRTEETVPGLVTIDFCAVDPLSAVIPSPLTDMHTGQLLIRPGELSCMEHAVPLGLTEDADLVEVHLAKSAHGVIQGITRSGKSITVNTLLAYASLMRDVQLYIIDPNLGAVAPWWRTAHKVSKATEPDEAIALLLELRAEMEARQEEFWRLRDDKISHFTEEMPLILLVIDEVSNFTNWPETSIAKKFQMELQAVASQGAKFGIRLWLLGQKLDGKVLTTATRTNLTTKICHKVDTRQDFEHLFQDASELGGLTSADRTMPQGVAIAHVPGMSSPRRMRSVLLPAQHCWNISDAIVAAGGGLRDFPKRGDKSFVPPRPKKVTPLNRRTA